MSRKTTVQNVHLNYESIEGYREAFQTLFTPDEAVVLIMNALKVTQSFKNDKSENGLRAMKAQQSIIGKVMAGIPKEMSQQIKDMIKEEANIELSLLYEASDSDAESKKKEADDILSNLLSKDNIK